MPFDFGPWLPDQPSLNNPGVQVLLNGFPAARGFSAVPDATATTSPQQVVGNPAAETPIPEIVGVYSTLEVAASSIDVRTYIGTSTRLLKYDTLQNKFSQFTTSDPTYTSIPRWQFVEFATTGGTRHIYAAGGTSVVLLRFNSDGTTAPAAVSGAPNPTHLCVVGRFVVCANTANSQAEVRWSAIDDGGSWSIGTNQSDSQIIGDATEITGLAGGETGTILTREGVHRMSYVGAPLVFTFDKVSNQGCDFPGSVASRSADEVYFLSEDGFQRYAGGTVQNIGAQRVNDFFFRDFNRERASEISCVIDPVRSLVVWSYASQSSASENDSLIVYDYVLDRWGLARIAHTTIGTLRLPGRSLESLDELLEPADIRTRAGATILDRSGATIFLRAAEGIDSLTVSFDSAAYQGGASILALSQTTDDGTVLSTLSGNALDLTIQTGEQEAIENRYTLVRGVYPHIDGAGPVVSCAVSGRTRQVDSQIFGPFSTLNDSNKVPLRKSGRYFALKFTASGNWTQAHGFSYDATPQGRR